MYFANDLDNGGYPKVGSSTYHGAGTTIYYEHSGTTWTIKNNNFVLGTTTPVVKKASEYNVAKAIKNKLGSNLNNIVIYQESHHGYNNSPEALSLLNLNKSSVYSIATISFSPKNSPLFSLAYSHNVSLSNTKQFYVGYKKGNGVYCAINYKGVTSCKYY